VPSVAELDRLSPSSTLQSRATISLTSSARALLQSIRDYFDTKYAGASGANISIAHTESYALPSSASASVFASSLRRRPFKDFCYLIAEEDWVRLAALQNDLLSANSDLIQIARDSRSWSDTRNRLLAAALEREERQRWRYRYYVFLDGDVALQSPLLNRNDDSNERNDVSELRLLEYGLLQYEPALAGVYWTDQAANWQSWNKQRRSWLDRMEAHWLLHPSLIAVHREAVHNLLPLPSQLETKHWFLPHLVMLQRSKMLYPSSTFQWMALGTSADSNRVSTNEPTLWADLRSNFPDSFPSRLESCFNWPAKSAGASFGAVPNAAFNKRKRSFFDVVTYENVENLYCD
jgi:hypothetical protein